MGLLEGKIAIITGSGGGIGREHALLFAREGAKVVVNDLGSDRHGGGKGAEMADKVVAEIKGKGGDAVANYDSVATREGADGLVWSALNKFGKLDIVVNNAAILRDKTLLNMSEQDFDLVLDVHLRGTFLVTADGGHRERDRARGAHADDAGPSDVQGHDAGADRAAVRRAGGGVPRQRPRGGHHRHDRGRTGSQGLSVQDDGDGRRHARGRPLEPGGDQGEVGGDLAVACTRGGSRGN